MPKEKYTKETLEEICPTWRDKIIEMMSEGASEKEVMAAILQNSYHAWRKLQEQDEEFRKFVAFGRMLAQAWWEKTGREHLEARYFQTGLWSMNMKNRFGWSDRQTIQHEMGDNLYEKFRETKTEELRNRAAELLGKRGRTDGIKSALEGAGIPPLSKSN